MTDSRPLSRHRRLIAALAWVALAFALPSPAQAAPQAVFKPEPGAWSVLGAGAQAGPTRDAGWTRSQEPALDYRYQAGKGQVSVLVLPIERAALARAGGLSFAAKASHMTNLTVSLEEQSGRRWTASALLNADQWRNVQISFEDFVLAIEGGASAVNNGRLDAERIQRLTIVDTGAMLASASGDVMRLFGIEAGSRRLVLDELMFTGMPTRDATQAGARALDGFDRPTLPWSAFGANRAEPSTAPPLTQAGLVVDYRKQTGLVTSLLRQMPSGALAGADGVELSLASRVKTSLVLKLEQSDGDKFETGFDLPGDSALHTLRLKLADFKRSDDSRSRSAKVDAAKVSTLMILDIGGLFASKGENRLWLQRVSAIGTPANAVAGDTRAPAAALTTRADVPGWASWNKRVLPVHAGPSSLVGDPSVMHDGAIYRMFYSCYDPRRKGPAVCQGTSIDGIDWRDVAVSGPLPGRMIETRPGQWDDTHETPFAIKFRGEYLLYFSGYRNRGGFFKSFPAFLGLAVSRDGVKFDRVGDEPILKGTPGGYDSDAVFSPSIVEHEGQLVMLYTGYCFDTCKREKGVYLMAATSSNGRDWIKRDKPVMSKADLPKTKDGAAEAEIVKGPDGLFYLFMSLLYGEEGHEIGVARSASPYGPWDIAPEPIVRKSANGFDDIGPIAPSVLIEGDKVRMWYHGFSKRKTIQIGYAEAAWPLRWK